MLPKTGTGYNAGTMARLFMSLDYALNHLYGTSSVCKELHIHCFVILLNQVKGIIRPNNVSALILSLDMHRIILQVAQFTSYNVFFRMSPK